MSALAYRTPRPIGGWLRRAAVRLLMVKWHPPKSAEREGARGVYKIMNSFIRFSKKHPHEPSRHFMPHERGIPKHPVGIKGAKQRQHVPGTPEFKERKRRGQQGSAWAGDERYANEHTHKAWELGEPNPKRPDQRDYDFGYPVGHTADGRPQTKVRVHMDADGMIHGHPKS